MASTRSGVGGTGSRPERRSAVRALRRSDLLADVPTRELRTLARYATRVSIPSGEVVIDEGDQGTHMCIVLRGGCDVRCGGEAIAHVGPGDAFGEVALLENTPRTASVVATEPTEVLAVARSDFEHMLKVAPGVGRALDRRGRKISKAGAD